ncbi:MAG TPA: diphthine--ammonia ligase [Verrucomicrobiae bacterium]|nr:diphthine--ammonia ligase [Verrucomicrobiae bacterium]
MNSSDPNAAVLWTGGKDSVLALHEAARNGCRVRCLVTFTPPEPDFLAHPIAFMKLQAEALSLPHFLRPVREPFAESYEAGLRWLKETNGIDTVITGDIAEVNGSPNWIRERSRSVGMNVITPLWEQDRLALLQQLLAAEFKVVFSCVKTKWMNAGWVGRELNHQTIAELRALREQNGLDLCGEQGEYHTLVTDAPEFKHGVHLGAFRVREREELAYLEMEQTKPGIAR